MPRRSPIMAAAAALAAALGASLNGAPVEANTVPVPRLHATGSRRLGPAVRVVSSGADTPYRRPRPLLGGLFEVRAAFDHLPRRERRALERVARTCTTPHLVESFLAMVDAAIHERHARTPEAAHG